MRHILRMGDWFYAMGRDRCGPVSREQLQAHVESGVITPGALVWTRSLPAWVPAIEVPGLLPQFAPPAEPATPSPPLTADPLAAPTPDPATAAQSPAPESTPAAAEPISPDLGAAAPVAGPLEFSKRRPKPEHKRLGSRFKSMVTKVAAVVIALGILGGGGYVGAKYLGLLDPDLEPRLRYLPDNADFFVTMNLPKLMTIAQGLGLPAESLNPAMLNTNGVPIDPSSVLDVTIAGNIGEKRWIVVATLAKEIDLEQLFPQGIPTDNAKAGGTEIYYDRQMAGLGMDFAFAMPSKSTMLVGPLGTLKDVLSRKGAPKLPETFKPALEGVDSSVWMAAAVDVDSMWRLSDKFSPTSLDEKQRWLLESISSATVRFSGTGVYQFDLVAHCKSAKDAPLIAKEAKAALTQQRKQMLEMLVSMGQSVDADTLSIFDSIEISAENGALNIHQKITREQLELSTKLFTESGLAQF